MRSKLRLIGLVPSVLAIIILTNFGVSDWRIWVVACLVPIGNLIGFFEGIASQKEREMRRAMNRETPSF